MTIWAIVILVTMGLFVYCGIEYMNNSSESKIEQLAQKCDRHIKQFEQVESEVDRIYEKFLEEKMEIERRYGPCD